MVRVQKSVKQREEIRAELDRYVDQLKRVDVESKAERWFPPHQDSVTETTRDFHQRMLNVWRG